MASVHKSNNSYFEYCSEDVERLLFNLTKDLELKKEELIPLPKYLEVVRNRVRKFLTNALFYNVNYKDFGHLNISHWTNFLIYPLERVEGDIYPFFMKFFNNTAYTNGGYVNYCVRTTIRGNETPFIHRRDFDLLVLYLVLTKKIRLSVTLCRSYLFKGGYDIFADLYKYFVFKLLHKPSTKHLTKKVRWMKEKDYWLLKSPSELNKAVISFGLYHCENVSYWTAEKIQSIASFFNGSEGDTNNIVLKEVKNFHILRFGGRYIVNDGEYGVIYSNLESSPYAFVWDREGLKRFETADSFFKLYGKNIYRIDLING